MKFNGLKIALCSIALAITACTATDDLKNDPAHEQAKAVFDQGLAAYNAQDYRKALPIFYQASAQGFFKADRYIGLAYLNGYGVEKNPEKAFAAFNKAAEKDITGQYWLGYCYENGIGTAKNLNKAIEWYQKSAQRGDHVSQPAIDALKRLGVKS